MDRKIINLFMFKKYKTEILFFFLILISRIPFASKILYSWDAVQLSLALDNFNLQQHQPHPPGYILYVGLGKIFNLFFNNPNFSYVLISIIASFFTVLFFYYFIKLLFEDKKEGGLRVRVKKYLRGKEDKVSSGKDDPTHVQL